MPITRRQLGIRMGGLLGAAGLGLPLASLPAHAEDAASYPTRPIRLIVPFPPGGTVDLLARLTSDRMEKRLNQPMPAENRAGAGGNVGTDVCVRAEPDGYTLVLAAIGSSGINYSLYGPKMPYKPEDLAAIGLICTSPNVLLVSKDLPAKNVQELIALAKKKPGELNIGNTGIGASTHVTGEMFKQAAGVDMTGVPYRGAGPMLTELMAGRIEAGVDNLPSSIDHIKDGRIRVLGVTSAHRSPALPDVPTLQEQGLAGFEAVGWWGLQAPARTPKPIVDKLGATLDACLKEPAMRQRLLDLGAEAPDGTGPATFEAFIKAERAKWAEVVRRGNIQVE